MSNSYFRTDRKHIKHTNKENLSFPNYWVENVGQDKPILKEKNDRTRIMHQMNIRSFFKIYEKTQTLSQYWFAAQQKASRSRR